MKWSRAVISSWTDISYKGSFSMSFKRQKDFLQIIQSHLLRNKVIY